MEKDNLLKDDFLGKLIQNSPLESPSDAFVDELLTKIKPAPEMVPAYKPFFLFIKNSWSLALISLAVIIFLLTSDLPFSNVIPGKEYFTNSLLPYFASLFSMIKSSFGAIKTISIPLMIVAAGGFLLLLDYWVFRKPKLQNLMMY
jgi:hypothetical protein